MRIDFKGHEGYLWGDNLKLSFGDRCTILSLLSCSIKRGDF